MAETTALRAALVDLATSADVVLARAFRHVCTVAAGMHEHEDLEVVFHLSGRGSEWTPGGDRVAFAAGTISLHPPRGPHDQRMEVPGEDICLHLRLGGRRRPVLPRSLLGVTGADSLLQQQFVQLALPASDDPFHQAQRQHLARAVLARTLQLAQAVTQPRDCVARAQELLRERFQALPRATEVARAVGVGVDHLRHRFKAQTGMSMLAYVTAVRLAYARDLLRHAHLPIDAIARACGYASHRHLSVVFRRAEGMTPRAFRQRAVGPRPSSSPA